MPYKDHERQKKAQRESVKRRRAKVNETKKKQREALMQYLREQKKCPCADCGQSFPSICMDFDHVRGEKTGDLSVMANQCVTIGILDAEIAKCDLVCANCHRIRTFGGCV